jgi:hypothetical protein
MRKIKILEHISLDGVIQAPGGPNEDGDYPKLFSLRDDYRVNDPAHNAVLQLIPGGEKQ